MTTGTDYLSLIIETVLRYEHYAWPIEASLFMAWRLGRYEPDSGSALSKVVVIQSHRNSDSVWTTIVCREDQEILEVHWLA